MVAVLHMYCIGYTDTLTISVPLQVLKSLGADFDGKYIAVVKALELLESLYVLYTTT